MWEYTAKMHNLLRQQYRLERYVCRPWCPAAMLHVFEDCRNSIARAFGWVHHATAIHRGVGAGCVVVAQV